MHVYKYVIYVCIYTCICRYIHIYIYIHRGRLWMNDGKHRIIHSPDIDLIGLNPLAVYDMIFCQSQACL